MIASFEHDFIFIKTHKTAGTSVEIVLSTWCGPGDVCLPVLPEDEVLRWDFGALPRNFGTSPDVEAAYAAAIKERDLQRISDLRPQVVRQNGYRAHMTGHAVKELHPELWERSFKLTIERHPYEKVVSRAYWRQFSKADGRPISEWIDDMIEVASISDRRLYTDGDRLIVDRVVPFENLWREVEDLGRSIGCRLPEPLPRSKGAQRDDRRPAREILSASQRRRIAERCAFEFELMGYEP